MSVCPSFLEDGSDRRETLGKRVSDDLEHFIFRRQKQKIDIFFQKSLQADFCFQETGVLEELGGFERHQHVRREKLLPVVRLFLGRLPWRRGKQPKMCFGPGLGTENDFKHLVQFTSTTIRTVPFPKGNVAQELL